MYHLVFASCQKEKDKGTAANHYVPTNAAYSLVTFTRAVERNLIKGLSSYNILQNPQYKEAFGISWTFANTHNHLREVRSEKVFLS